MTSSTSSLSCSPGPASSGFGDHYKRGDRPLDPRAVLQRLETVLASIASSSSSSSSSSGSDSEEAASNQSNGTSPSSSSSTVDNGSFTVAFQDELEIVSKYFFTKIDKTVEDAQLLLQSIDDLLLSLSSTSSSSLPSSANVSGNPEELTALATAFVQLGNEIQQETALYRDAFSRAIQKASRVFNTNLIVASHFKKQLSTKPWSLHSTLSPLVIVLSDVFDALRALQAKRDASSQDVLSGGVWKAPDAFERSTTKHWVQDSKLPELLLTCVGEAPLLVYGQSGHLSKSVDPSELKGSNNNNCNRDNDILWDKLSSTISSVYFDSPQLDLYRDRLARREGAQLLRARWYGTQHPQGNDPVFLELKTHHESWVDNKSIKERATVLEKDMAALLYPSKPWSTREAEQMILRASPKLSDEKLDKSTNLLLRMHSLVYKKSLRPCMRSTYKRLAFQSSSSNSLRLTLDRNVTVSDESGAAPGQWCIADELIYSQGKARVLPYAVFEIKLGENQTSTALEELSSRDVIIDAAKFSKFLSGAAIFNPKSILALPYWASHPAFEELFGLKPIHEMDTPENRKAVASQTIKNVKCEKSSTKDLVPKDSTPSIRQRRKGKPSSAHWIAPKKAVRIEPKTYFANERTFVQWVSAALFLVTIAALLLEFESDEGYARYTSKVLMFFSIAIALYSFYLYYH